MHMHLIIAIMLLITAGLSFVEERLYKRDKIFILVGYAFIMVYLATTKSIENTADASIYERFFYKNDNLLISLTTEPTYIYLSRLVLNLGGTVSTMFLIYALIRHNTLHLHCTSHLYSCILRVARHDTD